MKYMVISDIHGNINCLNKVLDIYRKEECSKLLILGDLFNYGIDYYREDIINRLNLMSDNIIAVSGNCDNNIIGIKFAMPYINKTNLNNKLFINPGSISKSRKGNNSFIIVNDNIITIRNLDNKVIKKFVI